MNQLVIGSSVVIKWFVVEPYSNDARGILTQYQTNVISLLAPDLIYAEVGNIVWKKHRFQGLDIDDAQSIIKTFLKLQLTIVPAITLLENAYQLAVTHQRTVYDALYLALSQREQCPFVTADQKLVNSIHKAFPTAVWVADWLPEA